MPGKENNDDPPRIFLLGSQDLCRVTTTCQAQASEMCKGLSMRQIRFRFDGQPINETDTPAQLEMEDEDTIDVFQQQTGGVY
ncbi:hypothetical protein R6Z07F_019972 [Ovis aries]